MHEAVRGGGVVRRVNCRRPCLHCEIKSDAGCPSGHMFEISFFLPSKKATMQVLRPESLNMMDKLHDTGKIK